MGHTVRRCTAAPADYANHNDAGFGDDGAQALSGNDDWMNNNADGVAETTAVEGDWMQDTTGTAAGEEWGAAPAAPAEW